MITDIGLKTELCLDKIRAAETIVLTTHLGHDGDAVGSMLALYMVLSHSGKKVRMILNEQLLSRFAFLPDSDKIECLFNQNVCCDVLIFLDCDASDKARTGIAGTSVTAKSSFCIDHHKTHRCNNQLCLVDKNACATGELLYNIFIAKNILLDQNVAQCLYLALSTDTGSFRYANTTGNALRVAAALADAGASPETIHEQLSLREFSKIRILQKVLAGIQQHGNGIISIKLPNELYQAAGEDSDGYIDYARYIVGCEAAVLFKEVASDRAKVSLRFKTADAADFAAGFGGGGHARAAGFTMQISDFEVACSIVIIELKKYLSQDGHGKNI